MLGITYKLIKFTCKSVVKAIFSCFMKYREVKKKERLKEGNGMNSLEEVVKINEIISKKDDEKKKNTLLWVLAIIGAIAAVAGIAYLVYRYLTPDYLEDFDDDFDDDSLDDFDDDDYMDEDFDDDLDDFEDDDDFEKVLVEGRAFDLSLQKDLVKIIITENGTTKEVVVSKDGIHNIVVTANDEKSLEYSFKVEELDFGCEEEKNM